MKAIYLDTSIKKLFEAEAISTRTYNCLTNAGYNTINDIMMSIESPTDLLRISGFGKKSLFEMTDLLYHVINNPAPIVAEEATDETSQLQSSLNAIIEDAYQETLSEYEVFTDVIKSRFGSGLSLHNAIIRDFTVALSIAPALNKEKNILLRQTYLQYIAKVLTKLDENALVSSSLYPIYKNIETEIGVRVNSFTPYELAHYFMSESMHKYIDVIYNNMCKRDLSVRAKKLQASYLPTFEELLPYFDQPIAKYNDICIGMRKTLTEIYDFTQKFKGVYQSIVSKTDDELEELKIKHTYPFLTSPQRRFVKDFLSEFGHAPMFYIINEYFRISDDRVDKIFSLQYGLFDNHRRTLSEIATVFDLTRERVRQLSTCQTSVEKNIDIYENELKAYSDFFSLPYISEDNSAYLSIKTQERLSFDFSIFTALLSLLTSNFDSYEIKETTIVVSKKKPMSKLNVRRLISSIESLISSRFTKETKVPIKSLANDNGYEQVLELIRYIVKEIYHLNVVNDEIIFQQNFIDISDVLYNILVEKGEPMSVPELFEQFKKLYPEHQFNDPSQIKVYLYRHEHIRSIGKQSLYGVDSWKNLYFGTIRDLMFEIVSNSDEPVHVGEIYEKVVEYFPDTNIKSVSSSIQSDTSDRFIIFQDGYIGVKGKEYNTDFQERQSYQRFGFVERMQNFREFVETYRRFPLSNGGEEEASLRRWYYNVENCIIEAPSEELLDEFLNMIESYKQLGIPRTGYESQFFDMCDEYKSYINTHYTLPTAKNGSELYWWLRRSRENYDSYIDHRRAYLTDLLQYISSLGFEIK